MWVVSCSDEGWREQSLRARQGTGSRGLSSWNGKGCVVASNRMGVSGRTDGHGSVGRTVMAGEGMAVPVSEPWSGMGCFVSCRGQRWLVARIVGLVLIQGIF